MKNVFVVFAVIMCTQIAFGVEYEVINLGNFGVVGSVAFGINNSGAIVGGAQVRVGQYETGHAFLYENGTMIDLTSKLGNPVSSCARAVNNNGQIIVDAPYGSSYVCRLDADGTLKKLQGETAEAINDSGIAVGHSSDASGRFASIYDFDNELVHKIALNGSEGEARVVNNNGLIAGRVTRQNQHQGFIYNNGTVTYFGPQLGTYTYPYGINDKGQIVGWCDGGVFLYENGVMTDLGFDASVRDINSKGQIIGFGYSPNMGFLYDKGSIINLEPLPGHTASFAYAINDLGWIVGQSRASAGSVGQAVLWRPVPEPTSIALLFLGGLVLRRKKH